MKKKLLVLYITTVLNSLMFSQTFEIVKVFPNGEPFLFKLNWDRVEGVRPGVGKISFLGNEKISLLYTQNEEWLIYGLRSFDEFRRLKSVFGGSDLFLTNNRILHVNLDDNGFISIYDTILSLRLYEIKTGIEDLNFSYYPFLTGNYLFSQTRDRKLVSWELLENGQYTYRNVEETQKWLDSGIGEFLGYHKGPFNYYSYFGDFKYGFSPYHMAYIVRDLIFPQGEQFPKNLENFDFIGIDSKGLNYYWGLGPVPVDPRRQDTNDYDYQVIVAIIDTWTKKVTYRMMNKNAWTPPKDERNNLIGIFPKAIHPNGDVYFFDADEEKQEYELKRLKNDWWSEMGVDQRNIARITSNHIPLRTEQNSTSGNNGYNFANEYVWIQGEGNAVVDESGNTTKWIQIQKIDGRTGWIYESEVYWE